MQNKWQKTQVKQEPQVAKFYRSMEITLQGNNESITIGRGITSNWEGQPVPDTQNQEGEQNREGRGRKEREKRKKGK